MYRQKKSEYDLLQTPDVEKRENDAVCTEHICPTQFTFDSYKQQNDLW